MANPGLDRELRYKPRLRGLERLSLSSFLKEARESTPEHYAPSVLILSRYLLLTEKL
jgi:hypothetical protein